MKFEEESKFCLFKKDFFEPMVYFLVKNKEVVYVGKSDRGMIRINEHSYTEKDFDSFYFVNCKLEKLKNMENYYILKYKPKYNRNINKISSSELVSYSEFYANYYKPKKKRLSYKNFKNEIIDRKLYEIIFNRSCYINIKKSEEINNI